MSETGQETIQENKYVELAYRVIDQKSGDVLVAVEFPIGYIHGANDILTPAVGKELLGKSAGDVIEVPLDCDEIYGCTTRPFTSFPPSALPSNSK